MDENIPKKKSWVTYGVTPCRYTDRILLFEYKEGENNEYVVQFSQNEVLITPAGKSDAYLKHRDSFISQNHGCVCTIIKVHKGMLLCVDLDRSDVFNITEHQASEKYNF